MTGPRVEPIFDIPVRLTDELRPLEKTLEALRATMGRVTSIQDVLMFFNTSGSGTVGATDPGTTVVSAIARIDFADALIDSARLYVRAQNSAATSRVIRVYDTTNSVVIADVPITNTLQVYVGNWTPVAFKGGDRALEVRIIGNGAETQTLYSAHLQLRTARAQQR